MKQKRKKSFHPQLSDKMILKRVNMALQNPGGEIIFKVTLAQKQYKILTNTFSEEFKNNQVFETREGNKFCIFEVPFEESP